MRSFALSAVALLIVSSMAAAGQVTVEGVHLCCGKCVKAATGAFEGIDGISNVSVDKDAGKVTFDAADNKSARRGVFGLAKAGLAGKATHGGKEIKLPKGYKEDGKGDSITIRGVHNCCPGCAKAIAGALKSVDGVSNVQCSKKTCTVTGSNVSYSALIAALHNAGLHGAIRSAKK